MGVGVACKAQRSLTSNANHDWVVLKRSDLKLFEFSCAKNVPVVAGSRPGFFFRRFFGVGKADNRIRNSSGDVLMYILTIKAKEERITSENCV